MDLIDEKFNDYNENKYKLCEALMNLDEEGEEAPVPASEAPAPDATQNANTQEQNQNQNEDEKPVENGRPKAYLMTYCYPSKTNLENFSKIAQKMQKDDIYIIPTDRERTKRAYSFIPNRVALANILPILNENLVIKQERAFCCGEFIANPIAPELIGRDIKVSLAEFNRIKETATVNDDHIDITQQVAQDDGTVVEEVVSTISVDPDLQDYDVGTNQAINKSLDQIIKLLNSAGKAQVEKGDSQFNKDFGEESKQTDEKTIQIAKIILMYSNWKDNEKKSSDLNQEAEKETKGGNIKVEFNSKLVDGIVKGLQNAITAETADLVADAAGGNALMQSVIGNAAKVVGNIASNTNKMTKPQNGQAAPAADNGKKFKDNDEAADYKLDMVLKSKKAEPIMTTLKTYFGA